MKMQQVALLQTVDCVVIGASTAAVSAALALQSQGKRVFVVSDRAYFGDESAGALEVAPGELGQPGAAKHELELALLEAGIEFLFMARPVALRSARKGQLDLIIASRTSLLAIRATQLLDATLEGQLHALPGLKQWGDFPRRSLRRMGASVVLVADTERPLALEGVKLEPFSQPRSFPNRIQREQGTVRAVRALLPVSDGGLKPECAGIEGEVRSKLWHASIDLSADVVRWKWNAEGDALYDHLSDIPAEAASLHPQLWICGPELPLSSKGLESLYDAPAMKQLGLRIGEAMAASFAEAAVATVEETSASAALATYRFAPAFLRGIEETLEGPLPEWPVLPAQDVVVAGGGTGGAPAAIAAARCGKRVLLLEQQRMLGGMGTAGTIASYWFGNKVGFTDEVNSALRAADPRYEDAERKRPLTQWNTELKAAWYLKQVREAGGEVWLGSFAFGVKMEGDRVVGVLVSTPYGPGLVPCGSVVDASGNADIAAAAGAPCRVVDGLHSAVQGAGLSPRHPGRHYVNSDFTFIDDADPRGITYAYVHARAKFCKEFDTVCILNTRERRQIIGRTELSPIDFLAARTFPDVINIAESNFDTHGFTIHPVFAIVAPDHSPISANVPLGCLLPQQISGVIVTGLGMSAHRDSLPVIRMQADVQNQGYAAGLAAVMASECCGDFGAIDIRALQRQLIEVGTLPEEVIRWGDSFPLPLEKVREAASQTPVTLISAAILLAHPSESSPMLRDILESCPTPEQEEIAALLLGMMGDAAAAPALVKLIACRDWDEGWNYRGMGQFGMSASRLDALMIALGRTRSREGVSVLLEKAKALQEDAMFSHCRALSLAAGSIGTQEMAPALGRLLSLPGVRGHAVTTFAQGVGAANDSVVETESRNLSLRELYLAKGLYLCGDENGVGKSILEDYRRDLRGVFARHAAAVLAAPDLETLRVASI